MVFEINYFIKVNIVQNIKIIVMNALSRGCN